ncbi:peptidoglycan-binding domain-containing protein [Streptomyces javensis]|uniref:peptidoglycan-binding domain-containing protein n=1 Tax=Streptomyces javensis TaxID=114698 RepID=UPI0033F7B16E
MEGVYALGHEHHQLLQRALPRPGRQLPLIRHRSHHPCELLHHLGFEPGGADGVYGEHTTRAVKRLQKESGLPPDGVVGPRTWQVLRR